MSDTVQRIFQLMEQRHFTKIHLLRMLFAPPRHGILALPGAKKSCRRTAMPSLFP